MPALTTLALEGASCFNARTVTPPWTLPVHASIFRGVDPAAHGLTDNTLAPLRTDASSFLSAARPRRSRPWLGQRLLHRRGHAIRHGAGPRPGRLGLADRFAPRCRPNRRRPVRIRARPPLGRVDAAWPGAPARRRPDGPAGRYRPRVLRRAGDDARPRTADRRRGRCGRCRPTASASARPRRCRWPSREARWVQTTPRRSQPALSPPRQFGCVLTTTSARWTVSRSTAGPKLRSRPTGA
ncbi:alkaline phosphatase family protein [Candidatus Poriferisodalis sp.]|uniref:alkaline phosphatase family protein n=1 Tax=Candidatus Poriferisodalis sp. TaxID=3101277 RepID=UPI003B525D29